jgi:hypothetical protein
VQVLEVPKFCAGFGVCRLSVSQTFVTLVANVVYESGAGHYMVIWPRPSYNFTMSESRLMTVDKVSDLHERFGGWGDGLPFSGSL